MDSTDGKVEEQLATVVPTLEGGSESDQASADSNQLAGDRGEAGGARDLVHGVEPVELSREIYQRTARQRERTAGTRLATANERDAAAHARDLGAIARDRAADARDLAMARLDAAYEREDSARVLAGGELVMRAAEQRERAAEYRAESGEYRLLAASDRQTAAEDREAAARDRQRALADREALARQLALTETDMLTGARTRAAGLTDLEHELDRCRRTGSSLVVAYVDVVGLKAVNDTEGHGVGDELLKRAVALIKKHLRSYDLIIRLGGDEFLCAMSNTTLPDARQRFSTIAASVAASAETRAIRTGFAELGAEETAAELIAHADRELTRSHAGHLDSRSQPADPA